MGAFPLYLRAGQLGWVSSCTRLGGKAARGSNLEAEVRV